jgi:hypothetical protein
MRLGTGGNRPFRLPTPDTFEVLLVTVASTHAHPYTLEWLDEWLDTLSRDADIGPGQSRHLPASCMIVVKPATRRSASTFGTLL